MKKYLVYFLGIVIMTLGISLNYQCGFGSSSVDSLTKNFTDIINVDFLTTGRILIICNMAFVLAYYLILKPKDIILPIIVSISLGLFIDLFNALFVIPKILALRILFFVLALNLISLGVALTVYYNLSPSPYECVTKIFTDKLFPKLSYGVCKIIVEAIVIVFTSILSLIFLNGLGEINIATIIILIVQGPLIDVYLKLLKKIKL